MIRRDIIHPRERFVALPLCKDSSLRSLNLQTGNVRKRPFPLADLTNGFFGLGFHRCYDSPVRCGG
jgi:hypothetical protein